MKFAVLAFPGSNCEMDLYNAIKDIIKEDVELVSYKKNTLEGFDAVLIPGGFSYGDYLRSGAIARFSPIFLIYRNSPKAANQSWNLQRISNSD